MPLDFTDVADYLLSDDELLEKSGLPLNLPSLGLIRSLRASKAAECLEQRLGDSCRAPDTRARSLELIIVYDDFFGSIDLALSSAIKTGPPIYWCGQDFRLNRLKDLTGKILQESRENLLGTFKWFKTSPASFEQWQQSPPKSLVIDASVKIAQEDFALSLVEFTRRANVHLTVIVFSQHFDKSADDRYATWLPNAAYLIIAHSAQSLKICNLGAYGLTHFCRTLKG